MGGERVNSNYRKAYRFIILLFIASLFLNGCRGGKTTEKSPDQHDQKKESLYLPLKVEEGNFSTACGWLDDETIVYITELNEGARVYAYHLTDGKNKLLYKSDYPIVKAEMSPSRKYLLIHSSSSPSEAIIEVIDLKGNTIVYKEIPSADLTYEWNPFDENRILISAFTEDWNFSVYELNLLNKKLKGVSVPQPFAYWISEADLIYLNWDKDEPALVTDLYKYDLKKNEKEKMLSNIYQLNSYGNSFMAISLGGKNEEQAVYTFYTNQFKKLSSFHAPVLYEYSDLFIPYFDGNAKRKYFGTFVPLYSTQSDTYADSFKLVIFNYETGKEEIVLDEMDNEPISFSPNGNYCLYGNLLEKVIDLKTKEIVPLLDIDEKQ